MFLAVLTGCVLPMVKESAAPAIATSMLTRLFPDPGENTLLIPVWEDYPVIISEGSIRESSTLHIGEPVFTTANELRSAHKSISSHISAALVLLPLAGVGSGVFFYGYVIVAESGTLVLLRRSESYRNIDHHATMDQHVKQELLSLLVGSSRQARSGQGLLEFFMGKEVYIELEESERQRVLNFIHDIDTRGAQ